MALIGMMPPQSQLKTFFSSIPVKVARYKKQKIPAAIREAVWVKHCGRAFEHKCITSWCPNTITVFDFQCGHNIPESKGGTLALTNLYPLCARCNVSMGDRYTIDQWNAIDTSSVLAPNPIKRTWRQFFSCIIPVGKPPPPRQPTSPSRRANR